VPETVRLLLSALTSAVSALTLVVLAERAARARGQRPVTVKVRLPPAGRLSTVIDVPVVAGQVAPAAAAQTMCTLACDTCSVALRIEHGPLPRNRRG
jgi:hypothetical protein